jgi:predicted RNA-binding protein with PUA-like domain
MMAKWLMKSEPHVFSWDDLTACGAKGHEWDNVRNYAARNNMRAMTLGEQAFFYHSNVGKAVVGIMEVCALAHPDSTAGEDKRWDCVDMRVVKPFVRPVTLEMIKAEPELSAMVLVNNSRLSVQPVTDAEWAVIVKMGGL